jgi:hypothetical protein
MTTTDAVPPPLAGETKAAQFSKSERAKEIVGLRPVKPNTIIIDEPCELGYHCPVCKYEQVDAKGNFDERLHWSEYNSFLWCQVCNKDYPSALCQPDVDKAIDAFLSTIEDAITHRTAALAAQVERMREALTTCRDACRANLNKYAEKNETQLLHAFNAANDLLRNFAAAVPAAGAGEGEEKH